MVFDNEYIYIEEEEECGGKCRESFDNYKKAEEGKIRNVIANQQK